MMFVSLVNRTGINASMLLRSSSAAAARPCIMIHQGAWISSSTSATGSTVAAKSSSAQPQPTPSMMKMTGTSKRVGALAMKVGMLTLYDHDTGASHACTALLIEDCQVIQTFHDEIKGYYSMQVGAGIARPKTVHSGLRGLFGKFEIPIKRHLGEFRVTKDALLPVGTSITALHFMPGQYVDVTGTTIGKGFQGGMKRFGFGGLPRSHGVSVSHRSLGSTGCRQDPGRVWKGKGMPGRMGGVKDTVQNLVVQEVDALRNIVFVRGHVPGNKGGLIRMRDALLKPPANLPDTLKEKIPFPTFPWNRIDLGAPGLTVPTFPSRVHMPMYKDVKESDRLEPTIKKFADKDSILQKLGLDVAALRVASSSLAKPAAPAAESKQKPAAAAPAAASGGAQAQKKKGK